MMENRYKDVDQLVSKWGMPFRFVVMDRSFILWKLFLCLFLYFLYLYYFISRSVSDVFIVCLFE